MENWDVSLFPMGVGASIVIGFISLVGGLVGWLLIMKKVYKCVKFGFILDRP